MNTPTIVIPTPDQQGQQGAFPLAAGSERPFKFGDAVQARRKGGEWLDGFFFIAHVPELDCPYIVKGDLSGAGCNYPLRAHNEVRYASPNTSSQRTRHPTPHHQQTEAPTQGQRPGSL